MYVNVNVYVKKRVGVGRYINNLKKSTNILIMEYLLIYFIHIFCYWFTSMYYDNYKRNYKLLKDSIRGSIYNQIFITFPFIYFNFKGYKFRSGRENIISSICLIPFLVVMADIYFYITHIFCHKYLWFIHKYHHKGKNFAVKSLDAHMIEHILCNLVSIIIGLKILQLYNFYMNIYILCLWTAMTTINTCLTHTEEYDKEGIHLVHHKYHNYNYGVGFYIMDRIFGTYKIRGNSR